MCKNMSQVVSEYMETWLEEGSCFRRGSTVPSYRPNTPPEKKKNRLVPHVRITKLHCYCKHSVFRIVRARAQIG